MRIIYFGTPDFAIPALMALHESRHRVVLAVTQPDRPRGRGKRVSPSPVKAKAMELGIPVAQPETVRGAREFFDSMTRMAPDLIVVAAYGKILPKEVLELPRLGCVNIHASLLPRYRGAAPIHRAILAGERETGVCLMVLSEGMDEGDVIARTAVEIGEMNTGQLHDCLAERGAALLMEQLPAIETGEARRSPQEHEAATYAPMVQKEEGHIDFAVSSRDVVNRIRAMTPFPGAWVHYGEQIWKLRAARITEAAGLAGQGSLEAPGTILAVSEAGIVVKTADGAVVIEEIQPPGKRAMEVAAFLLGNQMREAERFG
jgi:methionyl-tRNA formyltransferase